MTYRSTFIQSNLTYQNHPISVNLIAKKFNTFMLAGKVNTALRLVSETESGGILPTSEQTIDHLKKKKTIMQVLQNSMPFMMTIWPGRII